MGPRRSVLLFLVLLSALAVCCAAPALALEPAGGGWYWQSPQPQGQVLNDVTFAGALDLWAVGDAGTILHSSDAGVSWVRQSTPTAEPLTSVVFTDALHGWAAGGSDVYDGRYTTRSGVILATDDGGTTWTVRWQSANACVNDLDLVSPLEGWAAGSPGLLLHTVDGGQTWVPQASGVSRGLTAVAFRDAQHGCLGGVGGLLLSTSDGGSTWRRKPTLNDGMWLDITSLLDTPDGALWAGLGSEGSGGSFTRLARSSNGGRTWQRVRVGSEYGVCGLASDDGGVVAVGPRQESPLSDENAPASRVLSLTSTGATRARHIIGASSRLSAVASNGAGVLCAVGDLIVTSNDGGAKWLGRSTHPFGVLDLDMVSPTEGWATGGAGSLGDEASDAGPVGQTAVYHTSDGVRWREQLRASDSLAAVDFADASNGWAVGESGVIERTTDGGASWTDQSVSLQGGLWYVRAVSPSTAWAGAAEATMSGDYKASLVFRTTDGGTTWSRLTLPSHFYSFGMDFQDEDEGWVAGVLADNEAQTYSPEVLRTTDGGASWVTLSLSDLIPGAEVFPLAIEFADAQHGWISALDFSGVTAHVLKTDDGGDTWQSVSTSTTNVFGAFEFVSPLEGWASGDGLYHTADGGATWERQVSGLSGAMLAISAADATHVWAGGAGLLSTIDAAGDSAPPVTLSDVAGGWSRSPVAMHLSAADVGGSGLVSTEWRVDGGGWTAGLTPPVFPAPADHSGDGRHIVEYRSVDAAGNVEPIQTVGAYIDTIRPVVSLRRAFIGRDRVLRITMRITDASCPSVQRIAMKVRDEQGRLRVSGWSMGEHWLTNGWFTYRDRGRWNFLPPGAYSIQVRVWDQAGNVPVRDARGVLTVYKRAKGAGTRAQAVGPIVIRRSARADAAGLPLPLGDKVTALLRWSGGHAE